MVLSVGDSFPLTYRIRVGDLAAKHGRLAMYDLQEVVDTAGLMAYS